MKITTNQKTWSAFSKADWLELTPSGSSLVIKADANRLPASREAIITVSAGGYTKEVQVYQGGLGVELQLSSNKIEATQWGGLFTFDLQTNIQNLVVENELDWVTVTEDKANAKVLVEVAENKDRAKRSGKIFLAGPNNQGATEIEIAQDGIIFYILPFWEVGARDDKITPFEEARNSKLYVQPNGRDNYTIWGFTTASPVYTRVFYDVNMHSGLIQAQVNATNKQTWDANIDGYKMMLLENGYTQTDDPDKFVNLEGSVEASFNEADGEFFVFFKFVPMQKGPHPTWDDFPLGLTEFGTADKARVIEYETKEAAEKGTLNDKVSMDLSDGKTQFVYFDVKGSNTKQIARYYFVEKPGAGSKNLIQTALIYNDMNLWKYTAADGNLYYTKEFEKMLMKSDFRYMTIYQGMDVFVNQVKGLMLMIGWVPSYDPDYEGNVLEVRLSAYGTPAGSSTNAVPTAPESKKIVSLNR